MAREWLQDSRKQAEERFRALPFPGAKDENFRFTPFAYRELTLASLAGELPVSMASLDEGEGALLKLEGERAGLIGKAEGISFTDLARASDSHAKYFLPEPALPEDKYAQLTSARWKNGAFLLVPANTKAAKPVRILSKPEAGEEHFRHLIILEEGAEAVVVQESWSDDSARLFGELTEIRLAKGSRLHWVQLQCLGVNTEAILRQKVELAEGAELRFTPLHLGAKLIQTRQETELKGARAFFETQGAARGAGQQHFDFWLNVKHSSPHSRSKMDYWFVMAGKAKGVFNGQIEIPKGAVECESSQKSKSLLLGSGTVHTIPKLLIATDAVKCAHGASVSTVSFEQLHYLQSRGITKNEAERMIVHGFTEPVVERLPTEALQGRAEAMLDAKQGGGMQ